MNNMMRACLLVAAALLMIRCGAIDPPDQDIRYHYLSRDEMDQKFGAQYVGYATWHEDLNDNYCDVYMLEDIQYYFYSEDCYEAMLAHEERHCREGNWHVNGDEQSTEPECNAAAQYCIDHGACEGE
jgi:hypothetical protein